MIEKLQAKKRILEAALQDAYKDLGEAFYRTGYEGKAAISCRSKVASIDAKIRNLDIAIAEIDSVEREFYKVPAVAPAPIEGNIVPPEHSNDIQF